MPFNTALDFTRASAATARTATGKIQEVLTDQQRLVGNREGLLLEEARTNKLTHSQTFDTGDWGTYGASVVAVTEGLSFNGSDGFKLTEDNSYGSHLLYQPQAHYTGENSYWIVVEPAERTNIRILAKDDNGSHFVDFDLENLIVTNEFEAEGKIFKANGLVYCELQFTTISSSVLPFGFYIRLIKGEGNANYQGDGSSGVIIYASQGEEGSFATSYIPTTSAQVTRAADSCERVLGDEFNTQSFTAIFSANIPRLADSPLTLDSRIRLFEFNDGEPDRITVYITDNQVLSAYIKEAGSTVDAAAPPFTLSENGVYGIKVEGLEVTMAFNGEVYTETMTRLPTATKLIIGSWVNFTESVNAPIKNFRLFPAALSDAELITLTGGT